VYVQRICAAPTGDLMHGVWDRWEVGVYAPKGEEEVVGGLRRGTGRGKGGEEGG